MPQYKTVFFFFFLRMALILSKLIFPLVAWFQFNDLWWVSTVKKNVTGFCCNSHTLFVRQSSGCPQENIKNHKAVIILTAYLGSYTVRNHVWPAGRNYSKSSESCSIAEDSGAANPQSISKISCRFDCPLQLLVLLLALNLWQGLVIEKVFSQIAARTWRDP